MMTLADEPLRGQRSAVDSSSDTDVRARLALVGEYALGIAHDFANILTVVHANASVLAMRHASDYSTPMPEELSDIIASARRGSEMIHRLTQFVHQVPIRAPLIAVDAAVEALPRQVRALLPSHISLDVKIKPIASMIRAEVSQIEEIVLNLAANARDAMPAGGVVDLSVYPSNSTGENIFEPIAAHSITIALRDTGCGMDEATSRRMFDPFFTTKREGSGLGIGMSMTRALVKQLNGTIEVESEIGEGTTIRIVLPVERAN